MYELARVRLHSAGPPGARYQDLTLDLREVGAVIDRPAPEALFTLDSELPDGGPLRRPSPATVLFLENGGGKSVLLKLIFSVMLPFRRQVVGTTSTRVLEKFVLAHDVAHVALEWQHTTTGQRVVTGKVSAWRDHVVSADPNRLAEAWYSFRPSATFTLDTLPLAEQGRLVSMAGFHDRLTEAHRKEPELQVVWERGRENWTVNLTNLGLDPELFAYQRRMNAGEGEAADVLTFRTDEAFVDWLLAAVTGEGDPCGLGDVVASYATRLAERQALRDERDFVSGALERIAPLAEAAAEAERAKTAYREARWTAQRFAATLAARLDAERQRSGELTGLVAEAAEAERTAEQNVRRRILDEVDPASRTDGRRRGLLAETLSELAAAGRIGLPASRSYDRSERPHLPRFVTLPADSPAIPPARPVVWHPHLSWAADARLTPAQRVALERVNRWLHQQRDSLVVPMRERSVEVFGDEKALERIVGTAVFAPGRLTLELLRCRRVVPRFTIEPVGPGEVLLVVENSDTFDSLLRALRERSGHRVGGVGWGAGTAFEASVRSVPLDSIVEVRYFGDLDEKGLQVPTNAAGSAEREGLPPVLPAIGLYEALLGLAELQPGQRRVAPSAAARLTGWLAEGHRVASTALRCGGQRLAQEAVGLAYLLRHDDWLDGLA